MVLCYNAYFFFLNHCKSNYSKISLLSYYLSVALTWRSLLCRRFGPGTILLANSSAPGLCINFIRRNFNDTKYELSGQTTTNVRNNPAVIIVHNGPLSEFGRYIESNILTSYTPGGRKLRENRAERLRVLTRSGPWKFPK